MARVYVVTFENVAVTAAQDFFYLAPADDKLLELHAVFLSQSSEVGDAQEEFLRVKIIRGHATVGSGGSAPTPVPMNEHDPAAGFTARINDTTIASTGTPVDLHAETFNERTGWVYLPTPEMRPWVKQTATTLVVRLMAAPADSVSMSGTLYVEEH